MDAERRSGLYQLLLGYREPHSGQGEELPLPEKALPPRTAQSHQKVKENL